MQVGSHLPGSALPPAHVGFPAHFQSLLLLPDSGVGIPQEVSSMLSGISPTTDPLCHFRLPIAATWMPTGLCFLMCPRRLNIITTVPTAVSSHWLPRMDSGRSSTALSSEAQRLYHEGPEHSTPLCAGAPLERPRQDSWAQISGVWRNAPFHPHRFLLFRISPQCPCSKISTFLQPSGPLQIPTFSFTKQVLPQEPPAPNPHLML